MVRKNTISLFLIFEDEHSFYHFDKQAISYAHQHGFDFVFKVGVNCREVPVVGIGMYRHE